MYVLKLHVRVCFSSTEKLKSNEALHLDTRDLMRHLFIDFLRCLLRNKTEVSKFNGLAKTCRNTFVEELTT